MPDFNDALEDVLDYEDDEERECTDCGDTLSNASTCPHSSDYNLCIECCDCVPCSRCGVHIRNSSIDLYARSITGLATTEFLLRINRNYPSGPEFVSYNGINYLQEEGVRLFCSQHLTGTWILADPPPPKEKKSNKIELVDYKEDLNDRTEKTKQVLLDSKTVMKVNSANAKTPQFTPGVPCERFPSKTYVGLEIEAESGGSKELEAVVNKWGGCLVPDGSVSSGYEIRTAPTFGDRFVQMIKEITEEAQRSSSSINYKCGLHVHVDMRDVEIEKIYNFAFLWCLFESQLFAIQPASRRGVGKEATGFCKPLSPRWRVMQVLDKDDYTYDHRLGFLLAGKMRPFSLLMKEGYASDRYMAFNINAYQAHKTIELRLAAGTLMEKKIVPWTVICVALRDAGVNLSREEILKIANDPAPTQDKLLKLLPTQEAKDFIISRKENFKDLNTPEQLAKVFDPIKVYQSLVPNA